MNLNVKKKFLLGLVVGILGQPACSFASEAAEFNLDEVIVTALRVESKDLETPAYVNVYTEEQLKSTGAANVLEAIKFTEGMIYHSMGPGGQSWAGMTSKAVIRGSEKGTLILVNGVKMNMDGNYNLEDIPLQNVERVEILKGAASVLYGSEAFGGVINVITKKTANNSIAYSQGNFGQKNHSISLQADQFSIIGAMQEMDRVKRLSASGYGTGGSEKRSFQWSYQPNEQWRFTHGHIENEYSFEQYAGSKPNFDWNTRKQASQYEDTKDYLRLHYDGARWDVGIYSNLQQRDYDKYTSLNTASSNHSNSERYKFAEYGIDAQTTWNASGVNFLGGWGYSHAQYKNNVRLPAADKLRLNKSRDSYSAFLQGSKEIGNDTTVILGIRQDYVDTGSDTISAFSPQFQLLKKLNEHKAWYINTGKSFKMPTFNQLYDTSGDLTGSNADLQPEEGWNYETGLKWEGNSSTFKAALFYMDYESIKYINQNAKIPDADSYYIPENTPYRNSGIELSYQKRLNGAFSYLVGASYGNPEIKNSNSNGKWISQYGRLQFNTALRYSEDKWTANLLANYFANRAFTEKPQFPVTLTVAYAMDERRAVSLVVDNLLDRRDINTHSTSYYYSLPRSYRIGYTQTF